MPSRVTREETKTRQGTGYYVRRTITDIQRLILDHPLVSPQPSPESVKITRQSIKRVHLSVAKKKELWKGTRRHKNPRTHQRNLSIGRSYERIATIHTP